jgi:hypothetical protein
MEGVELTIVQYIHSCEHQESLLNTDFGIKNEGQELTSSQRARHHRKHCFAQMTR